MTTTDTATLDYLRSEAHNLTNLITDQREYVDRLRRNGDREGAHMEGGVLEDMRGTLRELGQRIESATYAAIAAQVGISVQQVAEVARLLEGER